MRTNVLVFTVLAALAIPSALLAQEEISWQQNASTLRGRNGEQFTFRCPSANAVGFLWGANTYSDDSSICTAAVHAGAINLSGGRVVIEIRPGLSSYGAAERNGVQSREWEAWNGSFVVVEGRSAGKVRTETISWSSNATALRGRNGERFERVCPPSGSPGSVWGSGPYTDDSSICTAAVHAGAISYRSGGEITIVIRPGMSSYSGSRRNNVRTLDYGDWLGSFSIGQ